jgi:hypothetical protein
MTGMRWRPEDLAAYTSRSNVRVRDVPQPIGGPRKFSNVRVEHNGRKFDSKLECSRWQDLQTLQTLGAIRDLQAQVKFPLMVGDTMIGMYIADATYFDIQANRKIVEDSKGALTTMFKWKAKHFRAQYGFDITIVSRA